MSHPSRDQRVGQSNISDELATLEKRLNVAVNGVHAADVQLVRERENALQLGDVGVEGGVVLRTVQQAVCEVIRRELFAKAERQ